jgi:hypothetical protein
VFLVQFFSDSNTASMTEIHSVILAVLLSELTTSASTLGYRLGMD